MTVMSTEVFVNVEVFEDNVLVESINAPVGLLMEVPEKAPPAVMELRHPNDVVETVLEPAKVVMEVYDEPREATVTIVGPQGPAGDDRFHVGKTPPADTSLIWVDTSGVDDG